MGIFKCGDHSFTCDSITEWRKHKEELTHKYTGSGECENCGKRVSFEITTKVKATRAVPLILCEECKI